ncbi:MAG: zinc ribbon domain-containing protein, partial [Eubacteriales bacterium]|nr:zinc ribbon domain-containing protein [Eubacteriales bacterium]
MAKVCPSCGKEIADDVQFCNHCGAKVTQEQKNNQWGSFNSNTSGAEQATEAFSPEDINANKVVSGLAY